MASELLIRKQRLFENARIMRQRCEQHGIALALVTKMLACQPKLVAELVEKSGVRCICEAHVENLRAYREIPVEKWMIRLPQPHEAQEIVQVADCSLNSQPQTLRALSAAAQAAGKTHRVLLLVELGDLREGVMEGELAALIAYAQSLPGLAVAGIAANLSCFGGIVPDERNMADLQRIVQQARQGFGGLEIVSGGNSTSYGMMMQGRLPACINSLRMGESVLLGNVPCYDVPVPGLHSDVFELRATVVESLQKPGVPWGAAPGLTHALPGAKDEGVRKRALCAIGFQDTDPQGLAPIEAGVRVLGASSDYTVLDTTECAAPCDTGDTVRFHMTYDACVRAMASRYVQKVIV